MTDYKCPVCERDCGNPGGLMAHTKRTKDVAHQAHRLMHRPAKRSPKPYRRAVPESGSNVVGSSGTTGTNQPEPTVVRVPEIGTGSGGSPTGGKPVPEPTARPTTDGSVGGTETVPLAEPTTFKDSGAATAAGPSKASDVVAVTIQPPGSVGPLLAVPVAPVGGTAPGTDAKPAVQLDVPLEPFIAGSIAAFANGFILRDPKDERVTAPEVKETQFPKAVEASLRLYFPDVAWNHPLVALFVTGAGLASVIASKKASKKNPSKSDPRAAPAPTAPDDEDAADEAASPLGDDEAGQPPKTPGGTGSAYWDSILRQAQGGEPTHAENDD